MKKAKIMIALSMALVIVLGAGVGAGTYAYFGRTMQSENSTVNVAEFDTSSDFNNKTFQDSRIHPDKDLVYNIKLNNTAIGVDTKCIFGINLRAEKEDINMTEDLTTLSTISGEKKFYLDNFFGNPNLRYYFYGTELDENALPNIDEKDWFVEVKFIDGEWKINPNTVNNNKSPFGNLNNTKNYVKDQYRITIQQGINEDYPNFVNLESISFDFFEDISEDNPTIKNKVYEIGVRIKWPYNNEEVIPTGKKSSYIDNFYQSVSGSLINFCYDTTMVKNISGDPDAVSEIKFTGADGDEYVLYYNLHTQPGFTSWDPSKTGSNLNESELKQIHVYLKHYFEENNEIKSNTNCLTDGNSAIKYSLETSNNIKLYTGSSNNPAVIGYVPLHEDLMKKVLVAHQN